MKKFQPKRVHPAKLFVKKTVECRVIPLINFSGYLFLNSPDLRHWSTATPWKKLEVTRTPKRFIRPSQFERGRIIELKEAGWANRRIARHKRRSDAAIRRCWQKWVENGRFKRHDSSGRSRATADREVRLIVLIVESAVTASDSLLSILRRTTRRRVSTMTIHR
ncbi:HTH_Tnp_Tc3_2 domain-containing protein [Trichonephila clavipes]|nr:HTH_Tnp_Tc3_2 domain-containing protein [Trichonephila clavipes]